MLGANINSLASIIDSGDKVKCTAIWSPSKSALKAEQTRGCNLIALPSINTGWNACIDNLCNVGALFNKTGWSAITSSITAQTLSSDSSTNFLAIFILLANSLLTNSLIINGLYNSRAIFLGIPHWFIFKDGPTTITDLAE